MWSNLVGAVNNLTNNVGIVLIYCLFIAYRLLFIKFFFHFYNIYLYGIYFRFLRYCFIHRFLDEVG